MDYNSDRRSSHKEDLRDAGNNDAEINALPLQHVVNPAIASVNGSYIPLLQQYSCLDSTPEERDRNITKLYMRTVISIPCLAYFISFIGSCYQVTGRMATERKVEMPNARPTTFNYFGLYECKGS